MYLFINVKIYTYIFKRDTVESYILINKSNFVLT